MSEQNPSQFPPSDELPRSMMPMAVAFEGGLGLLAVGLGWLLDFPPRDAILWNWEAVGWGAVGAVPLLVVLAVCIRVPWRPLADLVRTVDELIVPLFRRSRLFDLALLSFLAGLGEELLFRGVIQRVLAAWLEGPAGQAAALLVASALFGLAHAVTRTYAVLGGLIGLYLGGLWIVSGNLLLPITAHAVYDFVALIYLVRIRPHG